MYYRDRLNSEVGDSEIDSLKNEYVIKFENRDEWCFVSSCIYSLAVVSLSFFMIGDIKEYSSFEAFTCNGVIELLFGLVVCLWRNLRTGSVWEKG